MDIRINDRTDQMNDHVRAVLERDLQFALSRFANEIDFVSVTTEDTNGPRGGVDKRCRIRAKTIRDGSVEVTQECVEIGSGLARAARRLGHSLSRTIKQRRNVSRETIRRVTEESA